MLNGFLRSPLGLRAATWFCPRCHPGGKKQWWRFRAQPLWKTTTLAFSRGRHKEETITVDLPRVRPLGRVGLPRGRPLGEKKQKWFLAGRSPGKTARVGFYLVFRPGGLRAKPPELVFPLGGPRAKPPELVFRGGGLWRKPPHLVSRGR